jgi:hypothetical protein
MVLYGCETWPVTLKEKHRLKVFENMMRRRIFGIKSDEMVGGWRKLQMRRFIICMVRGAGHVARMGGKGMYVGFWLESYKETDY